MSQSTAETTTCPRCTGPLPRIFRAALSRKDNETKICSPCGTVEAMRENQQVDPWPAYPQPMDQLQ